MKLSPLHIIIFVVLFLCSCKSKENKEWDDYISAFLKEHIDSVLVYNIDSLGFYDGERTLDLMKSDRAKILFWVDLDCSSCILKFDYWKKYAGTFKSRYNEELPVIAVIGSDNYKWNIRQRVEELWEGYWFYDSLDNIIISNELDENVLRTLMIDGKDTVRVIGSPVEAPGIISTYETLLQKYLLKTH